MRITIFDCNAFGSGKRLRVSDVIGAGPRTVAGILENYDFEVRIFTPDYYHQKFVNSSDIIMFSGMISDFKIIKKLSRKFKNKLQICGGPISSNYSELLSRTNIKIVVIGEAEITLRELIENNFNPKEIKGIAYKENDKIIFNGYRKFLDEEKYYLITPSVKRIKDYKYYWARRVYVEILRGCSNFVPFMGKCGCGFCEVPNVFGYPKFRQIESIVSEIKGLLENGVKRIVLSAPDFLDYYRGEKLTDPRNPPPNVNKIKELLHEIHYLVKKYNAYFRIENIKPNLMNEEVARIFSKYISPFIVGIGAESGDDKALKMMNKPYTTKDILNCLKIMNNYDLFATLYFIYGLPFENRETILATKKFIQKIFKHFNCIERIVISKFIPLPNSAFYIFKNFDYKFKEVIKSELLPLIDNINKKLKERKYLGKIIKVYPIIKISSNYYLCYPVTDGPYTLAKIFSKKRIIKVKIERVTEREIIGRQII